MELWSRLIEKCGLYCAYKVKNSNFQYDRGINSGVTGRILLIIELIWDLVAINTSRKFGPDWLRNVVSIALTSKEWTDAWTHRLTDARMTDELPWHKPLWPSASGAQNCRSYPRHKVKSNILYSRASKSIRHGRILPKFDISKILWMSRLSENAGDITRSTVSSVSVKLCEICQFYLSIHSFTWI